MVLYVKISKEATQGFSQRKSMEAKELVYFIKRQSGRERKQYWSIEAQVLHPSSHNIE